MVTLHYGVSDVHEFWECRTLLIFRNLPEKSWQSMKKNNGEYTVIDDLKQFAKRSKSEFSLSSITLGALSSGELAKKIVIQEEIEIKFDYTKIYKGKSPMTLKKGTPPDHAIRSSKKR